MTNNEKALELVQKCLDDWPYAATRVIDIMNRLEQVKALLKEQEAKNGYWIDPTSQDCHCSECGEQPEHEPGESVPLYDFCPYCGAKMEVKWNE